MVRRYVRPARVELFDENRLPSWFVVENPWHKLLEVRPLPPGTDLLRMFLVELLKYHDAGWRLSRFNSDAGYFFATKAYEEKRQVYLTLNDPALPPKS